jgi:hypothetical protein
MKDGKTGVVGYSIFEVQRPAPRLLSQRAFHYTEISPFFITTFLGFEEGILENLKNSAGCTNASR